MNLISKSNNSFFHKKEIEKNYHQHNFQNINKNFIKESVASHKKNVLRKNKKKKTFLIVKWLKNFQNRDLIKHRFYCFLFGTNDEKFGSNFYVEKIKNYFFYNRKSLLISFLHIVVGDPLLAIWLIDEPTEMLNIFQESCSEISKDIFPDFLQSKNIMLVRITELPFQDSLKNCDSKKINQMLKVRGVVISKTEIYSDLTFYKLICLKCYEIQETIFSSRQNKKALFAICYSCKGNGPFQISWTSSNSFNFQKIFIQEIPHFSNQKGLGCKKEVILKGEFIDYVTLGEEITVTGILKFSYFEDHVSFYKNPNFTTNIEANFIEKIKNPNFEGIFKFSEEIILKKIFFRGDILHKTIKAFIPSISRSDRIKLPLLLSLLSSPTKKSEEPYFVKSGLNILIIGDPSTGKTQLLKALQHLAPKSIYLTGYNCSSKGLTASLKYEKLSDDWILEGGALIFADKGFCLIDGIDKFGTKEKIFLTEALEEQSIKIKKNGISTSLKTRCTIIATSSPIKEYYCSQYSFFKNFFGEENFAEKFDLFIPIKDIIDKQKDEILAKFIVNSHQLLTKKTIIENLSLNLNSMENFSCDKKISKCENQKRVFSQKLLKKYIVYARIRIKPKLSTSLQENISVFYVSLRNQHFSIDSIKPSFRHLETIIRLVESSARLHLRDYIFEKDIKIGFSVFLFSFLESQPDNIKKNLYNKFGHYLNPPDLILKKLEKILKNLFFSAGSSKKKKYKINKKIFEKDQNLNIKERKLIKKFYESKNFSENGFFLDQKRIFICRKI